MLAVMNAVVSVACVAVVPSPSEGDQIAVGSLRGCYRAAGVDAEPAGAKQVLQVSILLIRLQGNKKS